MGKYLDKTGLSILWNKIKSVFLQKSGGTITGDLTVQGTGGIDCEYNVQASGFIHNNPTNTNDMLLANGNTLPQNTFSLSGHTHPYLPISGGTLTNNLTIQTGGIWVQGGSAAGGDNTRMSLVLGMPDGLAYDTSKRGVRIYSNAIAFADPYNGNSNNDAGWIRHIETTGNNGILEIAVGDDGMESIVVRKYNTHSDVVKEAYLFDSSGNTIFPGAVYASGFVKSGSSDSYVLLGGGGHKALSDFSMAHTHPYLPLAGGSLSKTLRIDCPTSLENNYNEGIRCNLGGFDGWGSVVIGGARGSTSGTGEGVYSLIVNSNLFRIRQNNMDVIYINTSNNVGIGVLPSYKLHVAGDIYTTTGFKKNGSSDSYVLLGGGGHKALSDFSMAHTHPYLPLTGGTVTGSVTFNNNIFISTDGTIEGNGWDITVESDTETNGYIKSDFRVGRDLYVRGNATVTGELHANNISGTGDEMSIGSGAGYIAIKDDLVGNSTPTNAGSNWAIEFGGDAFFSSVSQTSDQRLKENIQDVSTEFEEKYWATENGLIHEYDWIKSKKHATGMIAQELLNYIPEAVTYNVEADSYSVDYTSATCKIMGAMFKKIKSLENEIITMKQVIEKLKNKQL